MTRFSLLFVFLISSFCSFGQNTNYKLIIEVSDASSKSLLPYATLYLKNTGVGASTDENGLGLIAFDAGDLISDTLFCSYVGYESVEIPVRLTYSQKISLALKPSSMLLTAVTISAEKTLSTKQVLKGLIANTADNYGTDPIRINSHYQEVLSADKRCVQYNEAVVEQYYSGYPNKKLDKKYFDKWYYDDDYAFEAGKDYFYQFNVQFNSIEDQFKVIQNRSSDHLDDQQEEFALRAGPMYMTGKDYLKYQYDFLNPKLMKKFNYETKGFENIDGRDCYVIGFFPKPSNRRMIFDYTKKNKRAIYVGRLYVDMNSLALVKTDFSLNTNIDYGYFKKHIPLSFQASIYYEKGEKFWELSNIEITQVRSLWGRLKVETKKARIYEAKLSLDVNWIQRENVTQIPKDSLLKDTRFTTIRNYEMTYRPEFWDRYYKNNKRSIPTEIRVDLERENSLESQFANRFQSQVDLLAPEALAIPFDHRYPSETISDDYHWMKDSTKIEEFYDYLKLENDFANNNFIDNRQLQKTFYTDYANFFIRDTVEKMRSFELGDIEVITDTFGAKIIYEYEDSLQRKPIFDLTEFRSKRSELLINNLQVNENYIGINILQNGGLESFLLVFEKGSQAVKDSLASIEDFYWFDDSSLIFSTNNFLKRCHQISQKQIGLPRKILFNEEDPKFEIELTLEDSTIICTSASQSQSEVYLISQRALPSELVLVKKRKPNDLHQVKVKGTEVYVFNEFPAMNNRLEMAELTLGRIEKWRQIIPANKKSILKNFWVTENYIIKEIWTKGIPNIQYAKKGSSDWQSIDLLDEIFYVDIITKENDVLKIYYESPNRPMLTYSFDLNTEVLTELDKRETKLYRIPESTIVERKWAEGIDGVNIPMTMIRSRGPRKQHKGLILKTYGAYGAMPGRGFSREDIILALDGFAIVYAHVRGEGMLADWYSSGKLINKENSFQDYIICAEYLIKEKFTDADHLIGYGQSAGALVLGTVVNRRPELFHAAIFDRPFLDVLNSMMDPSIPLTVTHYEEWGNPQEPDVYEYMKNYCPYQGIKKQAYPKMIFMAGAKDFNTPIWQTAKFVAKLRKNNTSKNPILFSIDFDAGHYGSFIATENYRRKAQMFGFIYEGME